MFKMSSLSICSQNDILLDKLLNFYYKNDYLQKMLSIINGTSTISLRIVDWFSTNYSKKNFTMFATPNNPRFKVYEDYKLKLKAYSKKRFDPFCRWERIQIPIERNSEYCFETTIGQMNFFKWSSKEPLELNKFGIPEPISKKIIYPDILLIPLVAFDDNLNRLGYGGGFYDRYINKIEEVKKIIKIGLAFSYQKIKKVPINQYDKKLDFIITEKKIYKWEYYF